MLFTVYINAEMKRREGGLERISKLRGVLHAFMHTCMNCKRVKRKE